MTVAPKNRSHVEILLREANMQRIKRLIFIGSLGVGHRRTRLDYIFVGGKRLQCFSGKN